jgi:predicted KAP-like P-loop ATPase
MAEDPESTASTADAFALASDQPLTDPAGDRLGYAPFAHNLARAIVEMAPTGRFVIALYGAWGTGKTTVLNFVDAALATNAEVLTVPFNPWWFSGQEELTYRFLEELVAVVDPRKRRSDKLRKKLSEFASYVGEAPSVIGSSGRIAQALLDPGRPSIHSLKRELDVLLQERARRIVVLVDDLDRLTYAEMRHVFRLVKAVADFKNVTYVLALDREVAVEALKQDFGDQAHAYLEKIVQLSYDLPLPERSELRALFFEKLDALIRSTGGAELDQEYWTEVFFDAVDPYLESPRDIARVVNVLAALYPAVAGEVNVCDFIAMAVLRAHEPDLWDAIRRNPESFAGATTLDYQTWQSRKDALQPLYDDLVGSNPRAERALRRLFPKYAAVRGGTMLGPDWEPQWRKKLQVASPMIFPLYFEEVPPTGYLSQAEIRALVGVMADQEAFEAALLGAAATPRNGGTAAASYLERLRDYAVDAPPDAVMPAVRALFDVGDELLNPDDEDGGMFSYGNDIRIMQLLHQLLKRLDLPAREALLEDAIHRGRALAIAAHEVAVYGQEQGEMGASGRPSSEWTVSPETLARLKAAAVEKIRAAAARDELLTAPDLGHLLYRWRDWGEEQEPREWVAVMTQSDDGLVAILQAFLGQSRSQSVGTRHVRRNYRLDPKSMEPFLSPDAVIDRVRELDTSELDERGQAAVEQFVRGVELRRQGKDPTWGDLDE